MWVIEIPDDGVGSPADRYKVEEPCNGKEGSRDASNTGLEAVYTNALTSRVTGDVWAMYWPPAFTPIVQKPFAGQMVNLPFRNDRFVTLLHGMNQCREDLLALSNLSEPLLNHLLNIYDLYTLVAEAGQAEAVSTRYGYWAVGATLFSICFMATWAVPPPDPPTAPPMIPYRTIPPGPSMDPTSAPMIAPTTTPVPRPLAREVLSHPLSISALALISAPSSAFWKVPLEKYPPPNEATINSIFCSSSLSRLRSLQFLLK
ncbi:hypothetical protein INR49_028098, partial [Caranx melampygus]